MRLRTLAVALALACVASPAFAFSWSVYSDRTIRGYAKASASRSCLTGDTRAVLAGLEARVGKVKVISTCRPGAVIAGSGRPSQHRYGKAVDFVPTGGQRASALAYLRGRGAGPVITYASGHIHFDTGGGGRKKWRRR
jgi:uncharacterized protein YcbK (DUF882 family)